MFDIFKLNYIDNNEIKKIYVFFGSRKLFDGENKVEPNQLYKIEPENPLFKNIFSDDEQKNIQEKSIEIEFVNLYIHLDDTIEDIKKKIIHTFSSKICFDEIYLYCIQKQKITTSFIYKKLTNNNKIELNRNILIQYLLNIYSDELEPLIQQLNKEVYTYNDLLELNLEKYNLLKMCLTQKISTNDVKYNYITNPYDCELYDEELDYYSENYISTLNNHLLLDFGKIEHNNLYLVLASDLYNEINLTEKLTIRYINKIYFPFLFNQDIITTEDFDLKKEGLLSQNKKLLNDYFFRKMKNVDLLYNLNPNLDIDNVDNIEYTKKGILNINFLIHQHNDINIPLENLFKIFNSTEKVPLIRYSPGSKKEDLFRLYSNQFMDDGTQFPYLSKNTIFKVMKYSGVNKKVSFYIELDICKVFLKIDSAGVVDINIDLEKTLIRTELNELIKKIVNPILEEIQKYIEQSGYKLVLFEDLQDTNIEILDVKYLIQNKMDKKFDIYKYNSCLSYIFNIYSSKIEKGIVLKYKRVSNFNEMSEKEELITKLLNRSLTDTEIIEILQNNLHLTEEEATNALIKFFGEKQIERNLHENRKLKVKDCAGFNILIRKEVYSNGVFIEINDMNNIQYIELLSLYIDSLLRIINKKYSVKYEEDINTLCFKASKISDEHKKEDIISSIEKPIVSSTHIMQSSANRNEDELDELFDLMMDNDDEDENEDSEENVDVDSSIEIGDSIEIDNNDTDDGIEIGDDIEFTGGDPVNDDDDENRFHNFPLNNPNYFFQKMYNKDPSLFLKKKDGKYQSYSRMCAYNMRRQPVILTDEEKQKIDEEHPDSYEHAIHYGSDPDNKNWYICPRYWCLKTNTSISEEEVERGVCGGKDAIIPFHAQKVPKGKFIFEFNAPAEHVNSDGSYIKHYPGFLKNKNKEGKCIPCCFKYWNSNDQQSKRRECLENEVKSKLSLSKKETQKKKKLDILKENYIKGYDKVLLDKDRWGFLPINVQLLLNTNNNQCELQPNIIKPNYTCILRKGVENSEIKSFVACFSDIYTSYHKNVKKIPTIDEMIQIIINSLTLDKFASYFNGNLIQIFDNKNYESINIDQYKNEKNSDNKPKHNIFNKLNKKDENSELFFMKLINSYENFKLFLQSEQVVDHTYLWDVLCFSDKELIPNGLNLIIIEILKDDITDNIEILCPTNHYSNSFFDKRKDTAILIKQNNYYEPLYTYKEESKLKLIISNTFNINDSTLLPNLKEFLLLMNYHFKNKCRPLPSLPNIYHFKENIPLNRLKQEIKLINNSVLNYYIINYNGKVIGVNVNINDKSGYLPCYPSNIPTENSLIKFIDEENWLSYENTYQFLTMVKELNKNILCRPKQKVIEDDLIIGINTETNQFIPINTPVESSSDTFFNNKSDDNSIKHSNEMYADKIILNSQNKDQERINYINQIKLETTFYNSFRNLIKILLNKYENQSYRNELILIKKKKYLMYHEQLEKIIIILKDLTNEVVEFSSYNEETLKQINNVSLCFSDCNKPYCFKKENSLCTFVIPKNNLITNKDNSILYYSKIADELIRHHRIRDYILDENKYLTFSKLIYNISESEIILPQSFITKEYFDEFKNKKIFNFNEFIQTNVFDNLILQHNQIQKYKNKVDLKENVLDTHNENINYEPVKKTKNIVQKLKCFKINDTIKSEKLRIIFSNMREKEYNRRLECTFEIFNTLYLQKYNENISKLDIQNKLIELYNTSLIPKYGDKLIKILTSEGKNMEKIINFEMSFENYIITNKYYLTLTDILVLSQYYEIGVLFIVDYKISKPDKQTITFIKNGDFNEYAVIKIDKKASEHQNKYEQAPHYKLFINMENENCFISLDSIEKKNVVNYITMDEYITNKNQNKKGKIKLND